MLNLLGGKDMVEPANVVDLSVPARDEGSSTACERPVQSIGLRPEVIERGGDDSMDVLRSIHIGLGMRGERSLRSNPFRSAAFSL